MAKSPPSPSESSSSLSESPACAPAGYADADPFSTTALVEDQDGQAKVQQIDTPTMSSEPYFVNATPFPLRDCVALDELAPNEFAVTHLISRERYIVSGEMFELVYQDGSEGAELAGIGTDGEVVSFSLGSVFKAQAFKSQGGEAKTLRLREEILKHRSADCTFKLSSVGANMDMHMFVFIGSRACNQRCFWPMKLIYERCKCDMFGGQASKWYFNMSAKWSMSIEAAFGADQLVHSIQSSPGASRKAMLKEENKCLPDMCVSSLGLLFLLARWVHRAPHVGGFKSKMSRDAAQSVLTTLLDVIIGHDPVIIVSFDAKWRPVWPRPSPKPDGRQVVALQVAQGNINLKPLFEAGSRRDRVPTAHTRAKDLQTILDGNFVIPLLQFIGIVSYKQGLAILGNQILLGMSLALEVVLGRNPQSPLKKDIWPRVVFTDNDVPRQGAAMELKLASYIYNCTWKSTGQNVWGVSTDEGMVHALPLQNSVLCLPDNTCMLECPQVETAFDGEPAHPSGNNRSAPVAAGGAEVDQENRAKMHCNWIVRRQGGRDPKSWRPNPSYRGGAKHWLENIDNQLKYSTMTGGLVYFVYNSKGEGLWSNWRSWPYISFSSDLGGKGLAAHNALEGELCRLNCDKYPDNAHGCNRDFELMLGSLGLKGFWMAMMIVWNAEFGPDREHWRRHQMSEAMTAAFKDDSPHRTPLLICMANRIIACLRKLGVQFQTEDPQQEAWDYLKSNAWTNTGFSRCNMNRFMGSLHTGLKRSKRWDIDRFEREWMAIELDLVGSKKIAEKVSLKLGPADTAQEGGGSTATCRINFEDKASMAFAKNSIVTSVVMLQNSDNQRLVHMVVKSSAPVLEWHTVQAREWRCAQDARAWLVRQVNGECMAHISQIMAAPSKPDNVVECGFICSAAEAKKADKEQALYEDDFARMYGSLSMALASHRVRRTLHLTKGWPCRMFRLLADDDHDEEILGEFADHHLQYLALCGLEAKQDIHKELERRHLFGKVSIVQLVKACQELQFKKHPDLLALLEQRAKLPVQTQIVEDIIGTEKNTKFTTAQKKFKKHEASMAAVLRSKTITSKHLYKAVSCDLPLDSKCSRLPKEAFKPDTEARSMDFQKVQTTSQSPWWWSPGPGNHMTPIADLTLLADAAGRGGGLEVLRDAWQGALIDHKHSLVFRVPSAAAEHQWMSGLTYFSDSAVAGWPVQLVALPGYPGVQYLKFKLDVSEPSLVSIFDVEDVQAAPVEWRSWYRQYLDFPKQEARAHLASPSVRLFLTHRPESLIKVAARAAFWGLQAAFLRRLADHLNLDLPDCGSMCGIVFGMVKHILGTDDEETLNVVSQRLAWNDTADIYSKHILEVDGAIECMDVHDVQEVHSEQKSLKARDDARKAFSTDYVQRRRVINDEKLQGQRRKKAKAKAKATPEEANISGVIPQSDARQFLPEGGRIWKDRIRGAWNAHYAPRARISEPYGASEADALRGILKRIWAQHLEIKGLSPEDCPWDFFVE